MASPLDIKTTDIAKAPNGWWGKDFDEHTRFKNLNRRLERSIWEVG